ncbi:hypothetical protein [Caballeronia sp. SBC2]|uniref:hypothetical protein n=1 Tax=Caballeronia sp. SBC2 TaxID=2705547 RepID=UPI0013E1D4E6|nr:hypothetical protein [Caballeronia sp. SBC2]QIE30181.1 hypothetical protein SBC2_82570 [Caballeronia sp. SBC2]
MHFDPQIAAQYVTSLPLLEVWFCDPKNEKTNIGVNAAAASGRSAPMRRLPGQLTQVNVLVVSP